MAGSLQPLAQEFSIVDPATGKPTLYFIKWAQQRQLDITDSLTVTQLEAYLAAHQLQAGSGITLTPSGDIADSPTIAASVQDILDQISTTQGSVLYRNASDWVALAPGTAGQFLQTQGAGANPVWAAGGGGGGGGFFAGATGWTGTAVETGARATYGIFFTPSQNISVTKVIANIDPAGVSDAYLAQISTCTGRTTLDTITTVLGTSSSTTPGVTDPYIVEFSFASPVSMTSGSLHFISCTITSGITTTATRVLRASTGSTPRRPFLNAPGTIGAVTATPGASITSVLLSGGETFTAVSGVTDAPYIAIVGTT